MNNGEEESRYLKYLPSIYHRGKGDSTGFPGRLLKAFEKVLSGMADEATEPAKGIGEILDHIHNYFDPYKTPAEFLPWLAGWVALVLKEGEGWGEEEKRRHIAQIVPLYNKRGTKEGLEEYIRIYVGKDIEVSISEFLEPLQVGATSTVGVDTTVGNGRPYYFHVYMKLPEQNQTLLDKKKQAIMAIINQEKPAYTYYELTIVVPIFQIGVYSTVGVDTLLGDMPAMDNIHKK